MVLQLVAIIHYFIDKCSDEILVIGGWNLNSWETKENFLRDAELFSPTTQEKDESYSFSYSVRGHRGSALMNSLVICGGTDANNIVKNNCYRLSKGEDIWRPLPNMKHPRSYFGMSVIHPNQIIVVGGITIQDNSATTLNSVEWYNGQKWQSKKDAPFSVHSGCLVPLNETHLVLIGGMQEDKKRVRKLYLV